MPPRNAIRQRVRYPAPDVPVTAYWVRGFIGMTAARPARHPEIELHFISRGTVTYLVENLCCRLGPRSLLVINPQERHTFHGTSAAPHERLTFVLDPQLAGLPSGGLAFGRRGHHHARLSADEAADLIGIAATIRSEIKTRAPEWTAMCRIKARELAVLCQRALRHPIPPEPAEPHIARVLAFVDDRLEQAIANRQLAEAAGLSAGRLMHLFKARMGLTLKRYVSMQRVARACELLADDDLKIDAIAHKMGFKHFADFNRVFKQCMGMTAAAYRTVHAPGNRPASAAPAADAS